MNFVTPSNKSGDSLKSRKERRFLKEMRVVTVVMLLLASGLVLAMALYFAIGHGRYESSYVERDSFQAVHLTDGSVYYGRIRSLNERYIRLINVYYAKDQRLQPDEDPLNPIVLTKLGCERLAPSDQLIINRQNTLFWENLTGNSKVLQEITKYADNNPSGCPEV